MERSDTNKAMEAVSVQNTKPDDQNLIVALRIRPMNEDEIIQGATPVAHVVEKTITVLTDPFEDRDDILRANRSREKHYVYDVVFDGGGTQEDVYEQTAKLIIPSVVNGYNATVFAYGATGAGKTYTMLGTEAEPGIMARTLNDLFLEMDRTSEDMKYEVTMSYLEIYNEMIRDLLNPLAGYLELREDAKGVQIAGLSEFTARTTTEVMDMLQKGNKERTQEPTAANKTSSRSHAILQVSIRQRSRVVNVMQEVRMGKLFLIDLAGSERAANTHNKGKRMVEGAHINRSLLALGNCINALSDKDKSKYVNYRDSKLTRLLKDALGGNCKTIMIAHVSPASIHFEESRNTLVYADRAKHIKTKVRKNVMDVSYHIAQYTNIIHELREEIKRLRVKLEGQNGSKNASAIHAIQSEVLQAARTEDQSELNKLKEQLLTVFNNQMELRRSLMELNNTTMEITLETTRNHLLIQKYEQEKALGLKRRETDSGTEEDKDYEKQRELEGGDELPEPSEVQQARLELKSLEQEKDKSEKLKNNVAKELENAKERAARIEESLRTRRLTHNSPASSTKPAPTSAAGGKKNKPAARKKKSTGAIDKRKSNSSVNKRKSDDSVDKRKSDTSVDKRKSDDSVDKRKSDSSVDKRKSDDSIDKRESDSSIDKISDTVDKKESSDSVDSRKSNDSADSRKSISSLDNRESCKSLDNRKSSSSLDIRGSSISVDKRKSRIGINRRKVKSSADKRKSGEKVNRTNLGNRITIKLKNKKSAPKVTKRNSNAPVKTKAESSNKNKKTGKKTADKGKTDICLIRKESYVIKKHDSYCSLDDWDGGRTDQALPRKINSEEQAEILGLLCKVHELEIETMEMQSTCLLRSFEVRRKDMIIAKHWQHHNLCDEIIQQQRALIDDHKIPYPKELEELYELYQQENSSLTTLNRRFLESDSMSDIDKLSTVDADSGSKMGSQILPISKKQLLKKSSNNLSKLEETSSSDKIFSRSPKAEEMREAAAAQEDLLASKSTATLNHRQKSQHSIITLSSRSNATSPSPAPDNSKMSPVTQDTPSPRKLAANKNIISTKTRNIAALAAKRRNKAQLDALNNERLHKDMPHGHTLLAIDNNDNYLSASRLANHDRKFGSSLTLHHLMDPDTFSTGTADQSIVDANAASRTSRRPKYRNTKKSQAALNRANAKKRTRSQDPANYGQLSKAVARKPVDQVSISSMTSRRTLNRQPLHRTPHHATDEDVMQFESDKATNSRTVHQAAPEKGRGLTIKKRVRGPAGPSNVSTPQGRSTGRRPAPTIPSYGRVEGLGVTGNSLQR